MREENGTAFNGDEGPTERCVRFFFSSVQRTKPFVTFGVGNVPKAALNSGGQGKCYKSGKDANFDGQASFRGSWSGFLASSK